MRKDDGIARSHCDWRVPWHSKPTVATHGNVEQRNAVGWQVQVLGKLSRSLGFYRPGCGEDGVHEHRAGQAHYPQCVRQDIHSVISPSLGKIAPNPRVSINAFGALVIVAGSATSHTNLYRMALL